MNGILITTQTSIQFNHPRTLDSLLNILLFETHKY